jgi:choline-sulfatase
MKRPNILLVVSDEHDPAIAGCYGNPYVETPHMDRLADQGALFERAYTSCPICVPARNSYMTGKYVHQIEAWDNGSPLAGDVPTIGNYLEAAGYETVLSGRTHFVGGERMHGFGKRLLDEPFNQRELDMIPSGRDKEDRRGSNSHVTACGPGDDEQNRFDRIAVEMAVRYLREKARRPSDRPWLMHVGVYMPHFPLICPREYFDRYYPDRVVMPATRHEIFESQHPAVQQARHWMRNDEVLDDEVTRTALAAYYGLVTHTDDLLGRLVNEVDNSALAEDTVVIYMSDHGENGGHHGLWQKMTFFEHSVRVPIIMRLPGVVEPVRVSYGASIVDILPTLLDLADQEPADLPGISLVPHARGETEEVVPRPVFSEFHAFGSTTGGFMIARGPWKYIHYKGLPDQLFNTDEDPDEVDNRAADRACREIRAQLYEQLLAVCDPEEVDRRAKSNQKHSGVERGFRS